MTTPFSFGASGSPAPAAMPVNPQQGGQVDPRDAILKSILDSINRPQQAIPPFDYAGALQAQAQVRDPQGWQNKQYMPGVDNGANPFSNGFFKSAGDRQQIEQTQLGQPGWSSIGSQAQAAAMAVPHMQNPVAGAALASPQPFQLDPGFAAAQGITTNPMTTGAMMSQPTSNPWGQIGSTTKAPPLAAPRAGRNVSALGSPARSPFSF